LIFFNINSRGLNNSGSFLFLATTSLSGQVEVKAEVKVKVEVKD